MGEENHEISRLLHDAWIAGPKSDHARSLAARVPVPGTVGLRGRFQFLTDEKVPALPGTQFQVSWDTWQRQIALTDAADTALIANDEPAALRALTELSATHEDGLHPLPRVDALIALGDAARQADRFEEAAAHYEQAMDLAVAAHYRFGLVRALVSVGYLTLLSGAARQAAGTFKRAAAVARELDERVYLAAALTGLGDALARLHEDADAERALAEALDLSTNLQADIGVVNAAQQLGDLYRSRKRLDDAKAAFTRALEAARRSGTVIGEVNACDGLAEVLLGLNDLDGARQLYFQSYDLSMTHGYRRGEAWALFGLGRCGYALDLMEEAYQLFESALEVDRELGDLSSSATALDGGDLAVNGDLAANMASAERRARLVERLSQRGGTPETTERALADVAAALYRSFSPDDAGPLLSRAAGHCDVLLVLLVPGAGNQVAWLRAGPGRPPRSGVRDIAGATAALVAALARDGLPPLALPDAVSPLAELLPREAFEGLADGAPLLIVPLGSLWALPWPAIPVDGKFLSERCPLAVAPSLTLADHVGRSGQAGRPRTVGQWRSPEIRYHELAAFADDTRVTLDRFASAGAALTAVTAGETHDLVVIAGHGRPVPGIVHYLELAPGVLLTPAALLDARTPDQLVLAACWGAHAPGAADSDPLTLATIALTRGSRAVLATTSELADDPAASRFLNGVLYRLPEAAMPAALHEMTRRFLANPRHRAGYLSRWAPLITVGTV